MNVRRVTQQSSEFGQQAHMHHFGAQTRVKGEIEEKSQSDVHQVFLFTWNQTSQLLYGVHFSLLQTYKWNTRNTFNSSRKKQLHKIT